MSDVLADRCRDFLHTAIPARQTYLVAVSGGLDSMVLAELCRRLRPDGLHVYHLDHQLRPESGADAQAVQDWCQQHDLPCHTDSEALAAYASQAGYGLEEAGHHRRRAGLRNCAAACGAKMVLLAHHADDQAETVLGNILRGSGPVGHAGMRAVHRDAGGLCWLRPLLSVRRRAILTWAREQAVHWREDASNANQQFRRNFLRHSVLPAFEQGVPGFTEAFLNWIGSEQEQLDRHTGELERCQQAWDGQRMALSAIPPERNVRWLWWRQLCRTLQLSHDRQLFHRLDDLCSGQRGRRLQLGSRCFHRGRHDLFLEQQDEAGQQAAVQWQQCSWSSEEGVPTAPQEAVIDCASVQGTLHCRRIHAGERWQALGAPGHRTVLRWLRQRGLDAPERRALQVVADEQGIVWIPGHTIADRVKLGPATTEVWRLRLDADLSTAATAHHAEA